MPTDPTGRSFLSYRRTRSDEARLLVATQRERGIPTWQDVADLREGSSEAQIRTTLRDPSIANAILWLTPDVASSDFIRRIEAREILDRVQTDDPFFVVPVAAGGLSPADAAATVQDALGLHDLSYWNLHQVASDPLDAGDARGVADRVLRQRIETVHRLLPPGQPLEIELSTWDEAQSDPADALTLDWSHRFTGRTAPASAWSEQLIPAAVTVARSLHVSARGRPIVAHGNPSIPAALVLGAAFLATRRQHLAWRQERLGAPPQEWSLDVPRVTSGFSATLLPRDVSAHDLAVLVSVTGSVVDDWAAGRASLPTFRAIVNVSKPGEPPHLIASPGEALDLAHVVVDGIKAARRQYPEIHGVHLFMAVPAGIAVLIGRLLNTLWPVQTYDEPASPETSSPGGPAKPGPVQTYDHLVDDAGRRYQPAARLTGEML